MPNPGGLTRNIVQCLDDYKIPLYLSHTITSIYGEKRIKGVKIAKVDNNFKPIQNTEKFIACDCLILSIGLIPEIELTNDLKIKIDERTNGISIDNKMESSIPGIFACGNIVHVFDLVDDVTCSAEIAGKNAAIFKENLLNKKVAIKIIPGKNIKYVVPQTITNTDFQEITLYLRVEKEKKHVNVIVKENNKIIYNKKERIVKPAEMLKINITKKIIKSVKSSELYVYLRCKNES
jgi:hypothetical protein